MNNAALITARSRSSRFPEKILETVVGKKKSIDILIERARKINLPIILATSNLRSDDKLCNYVKKKHKILIYRGSNINKILRWYQCFIKFKIKKACIIDGDDLCFDYNLYKKNIKDKNNFKILTYPKSIITGLFTHILSKESLEEMVAITKKNQDTEMIEPFLKKIKLKKKKIKVQKLYSNKKIRLTLDYPEDLLLIKKIYSNFKTTICTSRIINFLNKNPDIAKINYFREVYWKKNQLKKIKKVKI
jgi:spore coat polysaccharide biosynthesis protein SpsF (cytidylyltransferase family)